MRRLRVRLAVGAAVGLVLVGCGATKVTTDWDRQADFSADRTYQYQAGNQVVQNQLVDRRVVAALKQQLSSNGLREASGNPDVVATYHAASQTQKSFTTDTMGYGFGAGWRLGGMGMGGTSTTTEQDYQVGTLVVDLWDPSSKQLVFRGTASQTISDNPQKSTERINKAMAQIFEKYPLQ